MIGDTLSLTYNTVAKTLKLVDPGSYYAEYYLDDSSANNMRFNMTITHTIPARGEYPESHLARLNVEHYDATSGAYLRTSSAWMVIKTFDAEQDADACQYTTEALVDWCTDANIALVIDRES